MCAAEGKSAKLGGNQGDEGAQMAQEGQCNAQDQLDPAHQAAGQARIRPASGRPDKSKFLSERTHQAARGGSVQQAFIPQSLTKSARRSRQACIVPAG